MARREYSYAELGMLFGIAVGSGLGIVLFASTGDAIYIAIAGVGAAVGLILGAGFDRNRRSGRDK